MFFYENNGRSAAKHLSNGERSETVRDGMGLVRYFFKYPRACLIFSPTPAKAELCERKEGCGNAPLESRAGVRMIVALGYTHSIENVEIRTLRMCFTVP